MAMTMTGEVRLPATREVVCAKLNDPEVLKACIPYRETLTVTSPTTLEAVAVTKTGPVKARFKGKVNLAVGMPDNFFEGKFNGKHPAKTADVLID